MTHYEFGNGRDFLSPEKLMTFRSVVQTAPSSRASAQYKFFSTMDMIDALQQHGWRPVKVQEQRINRATTALAGYQKHMVRLRRADILPDKVGDILPELILTNAHNTLASFVLMAGFFRLACLNGLIVSHGSFGEIHIRHLGHEQQEVSEAVLKISSEFSKINEKVDIYRNIMLSAEERQIFVVSALLLKYADNDPEAKLTDSDQAVIGINDRRFHVGELLAPRRFEDQSPTLWNTFNNVQEKLTKGARFERTTRRTSEGKLVHHQKVKGITGINENLRVNRGLWHLMDAMAVSKGQC